VNRAQHRGRTATALRPAPSATRQALERGLAHHQAGRLADAEAIYRQVLAAEPDNAAALHVLGLLANTVGQHAAAIELISRAIQIEPTAAPYHTNLGVAYQSIGQMDDAVECYARALALNPNHLAALHNQGVVLQALGLEQAALASFERSLRLRPNHPETLYNVGVLLRALGRADEAEVRLRQALKLQPVYPEAIGGLLSILLDRGRATEADELSQRALALAPANPRFHDLRATIHRAFGRLEEAIAHYEQALALQPDAPGTWINFGATLQIAGRPADAAIALRRALDLDPTNTQAHSSLIFVLDLLPEALDDARAERQRWDTRFGQRWQTEPIAHQNQPDPERRLRVGYVSADFRQHSAASVILPVLRGHDPTRVDVVCYSGVTAPDDITDQFRALADHWRDVGRISDDRLVEQILADQIDVLVDLSGHSAGNRLSVFARKPAPVQVSAWGYATGTGLTAIDAFLADAVVVTDAERSRFTEEVLDLPCVVPFEPPDDVPPIGPLPALRRDYVTFGSFHRLARLTPEVLDLWGRVVASVPNARMLVKCAGLDDVASRERIAAAFGQHGISADRLVLLGATSRPEHLAAFNDVDIQLDTFPQIGGVTTLEGLTMGVPSVTLLGEGIAGRISASFLTVLGLERLVAPTPDAYVAAAQQQVGDLPGLAQERATLRQRLLASPIGDPRVYAHAVEDAYRTLWRRWCARHPETPARPATPSSAHEVTR
jgi:predicted O-linked N-acetylglucosamine transferase (SPINDLY family)